MVKCINNIYFELIQVYFFQALRKSCLTLKKGIPEAIRANKPRVGLIYRPETKTEAETVGSGTSLCPWRDMKNSGGRRDSANAQNVTRHEYFRKDSASFVAASASAGLVRCVALQLKSHPSRYTRTCDFRSDTAPMSGGGEQDV